ncbi:MAG: site-2 protease family protein [Planctomycetota bacterium]|nr:site-2 protease family protein [Planctomycetota bacterium]
MGWEDRPYYRDRSGASANPLFWVFYGTVPLFKAFGVNVRAHASLLLMIVMILIFDHENQYPLQLRALTMGMLFGIITLHEFGHMFAARAVGGSANEVILWPLGGLAMVDTPHRARASFITSAAGPAVNVVICIICAALLIAFYGYKVHLNPLHPWPGFYLGYNSPALYLWYIFAISYGLLLFNLLPIYPLDGGQMAQAALWPIMGHYRSMMLACTVGMAGSVLVAIWAIYAQSWFTAFLMGSTFYYCYQRRAMLKEAGPEDWQDGIDYHASIYATDEKPKRRRISRRAINRARRIALQETAERTRIDLILAKVSASGMHSLTWLERRALRKATERQRRRELELSRFQ